MRRLRGPKRLKQLKRLKRPRWAHPLVADLLEAVVLRALFLRRLLLLLLRRRCLFRFRLRCQPNLLPSARLIACL